jgi:hypothetical protein
MRNEMSNVNEFISQIAYSVLRSTHLHNTQYGIYSSFTFSRGISHDKNNLFDRSKL